MKRFLRRILLYVLLLFSIVGIFFLINWIIIDTNKFLKIEESKNILVIGASRTANAINDKYLEGSINLSAAGDPLFYSLIKLRTIKKNNPNIDTIILSLDNRTLDSKIAKHFYRPVSLESKLPNYYNFLSLNDLRQLNDINKYSTFKTLFFIPKYTFKLFKNLMLKPNNKNLNIGGYVEVKHIIDQNIIDSFIKRDSLKEYQLSNFEIENLNRIVEYCDLNNIELIFINPPIHPIMYNSLEYQGGKIIFDEFLTTNYSNISYLDFSDKFLPDSCYADLIHLNNNGSKIFSKKLDQILKK